MEVTVERYGSRMFHHWYGSVNSDASLGLAGTDSCVDGQGAFIIHTLTSGTFALGCRVLSRPGPTLSMFAKARITRFADCPAHRSGISACWL